MTYLMMGAALLGVLYVLGRLFATADAATLARAFKWVLIILGGVIALLLILRGQVLLASLPAALAAWGFKALKGAPFLFQLWRLWRGYRAQTAGAGYAGAGSRYAGAGAGGGTAGGGSSKVDTDYLSMQLDHATGRMTGSVRKGRFAGRDLESLSLAEHLALYREMRSEDPQGLSVLEAYLDRSHGPDWRAQAGGAENDEDEGRSARSRRGGMDREEALSILGLGPDATPADIKEAHRRLMLGNHPDRGGSDYLAAKINEAKDVLLGRG